MQIYKYPNEGSNANMRMMDCVYPEVYYKVQPFIIMACDQMDMYQMPTQAMIDQMADNIHEDMCRMYPDMAEYAQSSVNAIADPPDPPPFGRDGRFRRRGLFRDLIGILLLQELLGRRGFGRRY